MSLKLANRIDALEKRFDALFADTPEDERIDRMEAAIAALQDEVAHIKANYAKKRAGKSKDKPYDAIDSAQGGYLTGNVPTNYLTR